MTNIDTDLSDFVSELGIDPGEFAYLALHPEAFVPSGKTTKYTVGQRTGFTGTYRGKTIESYATFNKVELSRVTLLSGEHQETKQPYRIVSGTFTPVNVDISLMLRDKGQHRREWPLTEFVRSLLNMSLPDDAKIPTDQIMDVLHNAGLPLDRDMTMTWQHMGADEKATAEFIELIQEHGAQDVTQGLGEQKRIQKIFAFKKGQGLPVTEFEVTKADRTRNQRGQGFLDFVDAIITNLGRSVAMRKTIDAMTAELAAKGDELKPEQREGLETQINSMTSMAKNWMSNLSGANERMVMQQDQTFTPTGIWDPVSAPVGRLVLEISGKPVEVDLWKNKDGAGQDMSEVDLEASAIVDTVGEALSGLGEEEPF